MIQKETRCVVVDNSGALEALVIGLYKKANNVSEKPVRNIGGVYSKRGRYYSVVSDIVKVAIKRVDPSKNIKKGDIYRAVIVKCRRNEKNPNDGVYMRYQENGIVLLHDNLSPVGTNIKRNVVISSKIQMKAVLNMSKETV